MKNSKQILILRTIALAGLFLVIGAAVLVIMGLDAIWFARIGLVFDFTGTIFIASDLLLTEQEIKNRAPQGIVFGVDQQALAGLKKQSLLTQVGLAALLAGFALQIFGSFM